MDSFFKKWIVFTKMNIERKQFDSIKEEERMEREFASENDMDSIYWCEACRIGICEREH